MSRVTSLQHFVVVVSQINLLDSYYMIVHLIQDKDFKSNPDNCLQFNNGLNTTIEGDKTIKISIYVYIDDPACPSFINGTKYKLSYFFILFSLVQD